MARLGMLVVSENKVPSLTKHFRYSGVGHTTPASKKISYALITKLVCSTVHRNPLLFWPPGPGAHCLTSALATGALLCLMARRSPCCPVLPAGMPAALLLQRGDATVTIIHSRTPNAQQICSEADIIVAACGVAEMVKGDWVKPGAAVIDVGINAVDVSAVLPAERVCAPSGCFCHTGPATHPISEAFAARGAYQSEMLLGLWAPSSAVADNLAARCCLKVAILHCAPAAPFEMHHAVLRPSLPHVYLNVLMLCCALAAPAGPQRQARLPAGGRR